MNRFADLADAYGGEIDRWPEDERAAARLLLAESGDARAMLADAQQLDGLLSDSGEVAPSELLVRRILKSAPARPFEADWRRPAVAAAAALIIGVIGGFTSGLVLPVGEEPYYGAEYADAFDGLAEDWAAWDWGDA
ncbi:hypothetical protein [Hyphobacterium sp.]|uniref:hypothetical protein n=1 Tax=Hyphobacterium sp. TaxID=2004662 RepID=UPI003BA8ECDB